MMSTGSNVITTSVAGTDSSADTDRVEFEYNTPANQAAIPKVAGVSVNASYYVPNAPWNSVLSYQILVGPGPGFPQRVYDTSQLTCSAGIDSVQVLVLDSHTLEPTSDGTNGQACFGTAPELTALVGSSAKCNVVDFILPVFWKLKEPAGSEQFSGCFPSEGFSDS